MEQNDSHLVIGYLQGNLSKEEIEEFYVWIDSCKENKNLFFEIKAIYDACLSEKKTLDIEGSWQKLLHKKGNKNKHYPIVIKRIVSYAAVAVLAVLITSALFQFLLPTQQHTVATSYIGGDGLDADKVILPDGTQISLGTNTTFHYDNDYGKQSRTIHLSGEAYFDVAKQKNKPFIVKVNGQEIEALGTKFNVMAYPKDSLLVITLLEGAVSLTTEGLSQIPVLQPNQQLVYNRNKRTINISQVDAQAFIAWTSGYYYFPDQRLESILKRLSHVYGVTFNVHSTKLNNTVFTGTFYRGQSVKDIMEIINLSIPIKYKIEDRRVTIFE